MECQDIFAQQVFVLQTQPFPDLVSSEQVAQLFTLCTLATCGSDVGNGRAVLCSNTGQDNSVQPATIQNCTIVCRYCIQILYTDISSVVISDDVVKCNVVIAWNVTLEVVCFLTKWRLEKFM